jgi:hypothetical protein
MLLGVTEVLACCLSTLESSNSEKHEEEGGTVKGAWRVPAEHIMFIAVIVIIFPKSVKSFQIYCGN